MIKQPLGRWSSGKLALCKLKGRGFDSHLLHPIPMNKISWYPVRVGLTPDIQGSRAEFNLPFPTLSQESTGLKTDQKKVKNQPMKNPNQFSLSSPNPYQLSLTSLLSFLLILELQPWYLGGFGHFLAKNHPNTSNFLLFVVIYYIF